MEQISQRFSTTTCLMILLFAIFLLNVAKGQKVETKIIGGVPNQIENVPYLLSLYVDGRFACGASLIAPQFALTAAHCILGHRASSLSVVGGATRLSDQGETRRVTKASWPNAYNRQTKDKDIAMLALDAPMTGPNIKPIELCNTGLKAGDVVSIAGWGVTREGNQTPSDQVRTANLRMVAKKACTRRYRFVQKLTPSMICAYAPGRDSCQGDSGGPLVFNNRLCGIVSFGNDCAKPNFPGVYTSINRMRPFIDRNLGRF